MFLLDANVLINSNRLYYPIERVPEFWEWLLHHGEQGNLKMPLEIIEEVTGGNDEVAKWLAEANVLDALTLQEDADPDLVRRVTQDGYGNDLTDEQVQIIGRDPFLIAAALASPRDRCVITGEVSKPTRTAHNRKVPDVCNSLGVSWKDPFALNRDLDFSTRWRAKLVPAPAQ